MDAVPVQYYPVPSVGYAISAAAGRRMSLPVDADSFIYSHFKHIALVPAPRGQEGVNISRLQMLDTLLEQLAQIKQQPAPFFSDSEESMENQMSALIDHYQNQLRIAQAAITPYDLTSPLSGAVFSLSV